MMQQIAHTVGQIDAYIRQHAWFDFHVWRYDGHRLILAGSTDLIYYHELEIIFTDVCFVSSYFLSWYTNTMQTVFELPGEAERKDLAYRFDLEEGYHLFVLRTDIDHKQDVCVAAKEVTFNTDTVFYYHRKNLKANERLADYLLKK